MDQLFFWNQKSFLLRVSIGLSFILSFIVYQSAAAAEPLGTPDPIDIEWPDDEEPTEAEVLLGKTLYFDPRLSKNQNISCATCHSPDLGFGDGLAKSVGTMGNVVGRNAPHIYNLAWNTIFFWDGRAPTLEAQALGPVEAKGEMNMDFAEVIQRLNKVSYYREAFKEIYGTEITKETIGRAIANFERTIVSNNSPFDQYLAGNKSAMGPSAIRGLELYTNTEKTNCMECHNGPNLTNQAFHNIGVGSGDKGREEITKNPNMRGAFKTPGLRNVALTAPYMHDGSIGTLEEVIRFYARGGNGDQHTDSLMRKLDLSERDISDLVAFLGALTDPVEIERPVIPKDD